MNIGFSNMVPWWRVAAILLPDSAPAKQLRDKAREEGRLLVATCGRKTRSMVITDTNQVVLTAVHPETLLPRLEEARAKDQEKNCR